MHTHAYIPNVGNMNHKLFVNPTNNATSSIVFPSYRLLKTNENMYMIVPYMTCQYMAIPIHPTHNEETKSGRTMATLMNREGGIVVKPFPKSIKNPNDS
jgi:hypothetical protein